MFYSSPLGWPQGAFPTIIIPSPPVASPEVDYNGIAELEEELAQLERDDWDELDIPGMNKNGGNLDEVDVDGWDDFEVVIEQNDDVNMQEQKYEQLGYDVTKLRTAKR